MTCLSYAQGQMICGQWDLNFFSRGTNAAACHYCFSYYDNKASSNNQRVSAGGIVGAGSVVRVVKVVEPVLFSCFFVLKEIYLYLKGRVTEREKQGIHVLGHCPERQ